LSSGKPLAAAAVNCDPMIAAMSSGAFMCLVSRLQST
jgi:hypothetical protein